MGEMQVMILISFSVLVGVFALYHAVRYIKGSKKHHIAFANITLAVIVAASLCAVFVYDGAVDADRSKYKGFDGSLVSGTHKDSDGNEYYVVTNYPGPNGDAAVAKSDAELSLFCKAVGEVRIYYTGGKEEISLDGKTCYRLKDIVKITPDLLGIFIWSAVITVLVFAVFNTIIAVYKAKNRTQKE